MSPVARKKGTKPTPPVDSARHAEQLCHATWFSSIVALIATLILASAMIWQSQMTQREMESLQDQIRELQDQVQPVK